MLPERFMQRVAKQGNGCWLWTGWRTLNGYGGVWDRRSRGAHRVSWELFRGPIPAGLVIDHVCRVRLCVNPDHLEPVTQAENVARGQLAAANRLRYATQTHCAKGHEFTPENTYQAKTQRVCRTCKSDIAKRYKEKQHV